MYIKILYILLFTWIGMHALGAQVYYVAPGGASQLSTNINAPGSLDFAAANAGPGDTVWVKAGNYGALNLEFQHSGTAGQPIAFIGYHQQPGDLDSTHVPQNINTYTGGNYASKFPTLDGGNRATAGTAIKLYRQYICLKNFHITNYQHGIDVWNGLHTKLENIVGAQFGNTNEYYNGKGITVGNSSECIISNCFIYNAAAEDISLYSSGSGISRKNILRHCKVFCDDNSTTHSSTDYYIYVTAIGNAASSENLIEHCYIERVGNLIHTGHGYTFIAKENASNKNNTVRNSVSENIIQLVLIRGPETRDSLFTELKSTNGASGRHNRFDKIEIQGNSWLEDAGAAAIVFYMDTTIVLGYPFSAKHNTFSNCRFHNCPVGISLFYYMSPTGASHSADSNQIVNCSFVNTDPVIDGAFVTNQRQNQGNAFINCIIFGYNKYELQPSGWASSVPSNLIFEN